MGSDYGKLTVFFEDPFWVGIFERIEKGKLSVCRVVFGSEPKDYEVWEFVLANYHQLRFSPSVDVAPRKETVNPKRIQREARKQIAAGIGTKSQQALQLLREENKQERKEVTRQEREAEKQRQYDLKQRKRREKHRGRYCSDAFSMTCPGSFLNYTRFLGQNPGIMGAEKKQEREATTMIIKFLEDLLHWNEEEEVLDAEYEPFRDQLSLAGLSEEELRKMDPDDRVAALEQANLDPYDFIYLAC